MRHTKFFSLFVFTALLVYGALGFYALPLATFQGDLTRMGLLPETLFGWTKPQPALDPVLMQQSSMREADVFIIGDSFSIGRVWQTMLTKQGFKVRTESWDNMRAICADIVPWLRSQGFSGKYLIIETVERELEQRLDNSISCTRTQFRPHVDTEASQKPPITSFDVTLGNYSSKLSVSIHTLWNALKYEFLKHSDNFKSRAINKNVRLMRIPNGCELFSHSRCADALFLAWDKPDEISHAVVDKLERLDNRLQDIVPIWVFVPNKSTAYIHPNKQLWNSLEHRFSAPNLLRMTQEAIQKRTVDLYPANNTHFSTAGYLMMGEEVFKTIRDVPRRQKTPPGFP